MGALQLCCVLCVFRRYKVDCQEFYGVGGEYIFMQDGAGPRRAKSVAAYLEANFPQVWATGVWPPSSPDLNLLDFFGWGYLQHQVGLARPKDLDGLKLSIRTAVENMPLGMVQNAVVNFYKRVRLCVQAEGRQFKHMLRHTKDLDLEYDMAASGKVEYEGNMEDGSAGEEEREGEEDGRGDEEEKDVEEADGGKCVKPQ